MARLFISYNRREAHYAYAIRQWLIDEQGWASQDIFFDASHLHTGVEWEKKLLAEAEAAEVMLFLASEHSLNIDSFCYRELKHATGQIIAVTLGGIPFDDERLERALPAFAKSRQVTALDQEPTQEFPFISPAGNEPGHVRLNAERVAGIGLTLRELGVAPNSYTWTPTAAGPFPGLRPLMEGDEAIFRGRDVEIRDGIKAIEDLRATITRRALIIQAPSGAGKSSFLRAGLWRRLRRNPGFTPLAILRAQNGAVRHGEWGLIAGLADTLARNPALGKNLPLSLDEIAHRARTDLAGLLAAIADADKAGGPRRTLLLGIDQAEEISALSPEDDAELDWLLEQALHLPADLDLRLVLTARDDSLDATLERLARSGLPQEQVASWRLHRLPPNRFDDIISGPAQAAQQAGWPLSLDPALIDALVKAASAGGEGGDALPILALALQRMVAKRRKPDGQISLSVEDAAAFLEGAISEAAKDALQSAQAGPEDLRRLVIPRLATWDPRAGAEGAAKRQVSAAAELFAGTRAGLKPLADALVEQRLLTRSRTETGPAYEVAHEALLRVPPLGQLIFDCREKFEQARILEIETRDWVALGKPTGSLLRSGERLENAFQLLNDPDFGTDLREGKPGQAPGSRVADYLEACREHEARQARRARRSRRTVTATLSFLSIFGLSLAAAALYTVELSLQARDKARKQDADLALEKVKFHPQRYPGAILHRARAIGFSGYGGRPYRERDFLQFWAEAWNLFRGVEDPFPVLDPTKEAELREELAALPAYLPFWRSGPLEGGAVQAIAFAQDGGVLRAKIGDQVWQWNLADPTAEPARVTQETDVEPMAATTGVTILEEDKTVLAFHAYGHKVELTGHPAAITAWALSPGKPVLVTGLANGSLVAWDLRGEALGTREDLIELVAGEGRTPGWFRFDSRKGEDLAPAPVQGRALLAAAWPGLDDPRELPSSAKHRDKWRNSIGMNLIWVEPGTFLMGSPETEAERGEDELQHPVTLTRGFWMGQFEVTQAEWAAVMEGEKQDPSERKDPLAPVERVSWDDVAEFCAKLTERERKAGRLEAGWNYQLPTEAQWEYACRAGTPHPFFWGDTLNGTLANCDGNYVYGKIPGGPNLGRTVATGQYGANPWGFHDMHGNVFEWCLDWYDEKFYTLPEAARDPQGPKQQATARVIRGGSWLISARHCHSAYRGSGRPAIRSGNLGFRPVLSDQVPGAEGSAP